MAIDIRATVTCSLGTLISGSISDDYIQGSGLVKTRGSVEISALITPAVGTSVTFSYTKNGVARSIPRRLRVLSSFADPFRRTTKVELGCKLTYLSDLKEPLKWDAFDDPQNSGMTPAEDRIITIPIYASSVMTQCLFKLGLASSGPSLTNKFSIAEFDFSSGYVQVLSDLLVSECYFGYLNANEILQIRSLNVGGGTGPVFTSSDIVDIGPIGVGQLPGEAVTVSYSTLKLTGEEACENDEEEKTQELNWEYQETIGVQTRITVQYTKPTNNPPDQKFYQTWTYIPRTVTETTYDDWDRVLKRITTQFYIGAAINTQYYVDTWQATAVQTVPYIGGFEASEQQTVETETFQYVLPVDGERPEDNYDQVLTRKIIKEEPKMAIAGSIAASFLNDDGTLVNYMPLVGNTITEEIVETYETLQGISNGVYTPITKTTVSKKLAYGYTQFGQQETARQLENGASTSEAIFNSMNLIPIGTEVYINSGRGVGLQERPSSAERTNAAYAKDGDPNNGFRTESNGELELAMGSATAQRRIELSMPYAPDDTFTQISSNPVCYQGTPSDAPQKAAAFGRVQNRLLLGNRNGMNIQLSPERLPSDPFASLYVQASGLTGLYRANGTSWVFDSNGIVASTDALFWGAAGGTGTFWFPVAPGITTLPTTPAIVDGQMNATTVVLPYNETAVYDSRIRLVTTVTKFDYSLTLLTVVPPTVIKTPANVVKVTPIYMPAPAGTAIAAALPRIESTAPVRVITTPAVTIAAKVPDVGSGIGLVVAPPASATAIAAPVPTITTV
jgi:hypothetical protein